MFKPGDKVICIDTDGIKSIAQMYEKFTICDVSENGKYVSITKYYTPGLRESRFILDVKEERKLKLEKLWIKSEML